MSAETEDSARRIIARLPWRSPTVGASRMQAMRVMPARAYVGSTPTWSSRPVTRFIFVPVSLRSRSSSRRESRESA